MQDLNRYRDNSQKKFSNNSQRADESSVSILCTSVSRRSCSDWDIFSFSNSFKMQDRKENELLDRFGCITPQSAAMLQESVNELLDYSEISSIQEDLTEMLHNFMTCTKALKLYSIDYFSNALGTVTRVNKLLSKIQEASNKNLSTPQKMAYELN